MLALVWFVGALGCFNRPRKDKLYAFLLDPSGKSKGQNYYGLLAEVLNIRR